MRISAVETRRYAIPLDPPFRAGLGSRPARAPGGDVVLVRTRRRRRRAIASGGDGLPDRELLERLLVGVDPLRTRGRARDLRDGRLPRRPAVGGRGRGLGSRRHARSDSRCWQLLGGRSERLRRLRVERRAARAGRARRARAVALRERGVRAVKLRFHHADWRDDVAVVEAVRDAVGADSSSWSTPTRAGGCPATASRAGTSRPPRSARASSSGSASTGSRSRCATDDVDGYAALRG